MPTHTGKDSKGCYAQWGGHGKKYYYTCGNKAARNRAIRKANAQGQAAHAHGYTGNKAMAHFEYVTFNTKPVIRHDSMEGRDWVVAPTQMITEGVHNGSDGPIFYPADELAKLPAVWNHKPVVVYHPTVNGQSVSACDPIQLTTRKVGVLLNTKWDAENKKLGTETWLDPDRIQKVDNRVAEAIENNEMMEVSTGLFMDLERTEGEWNGEEYIGIARNLQPDHLALLPDQKGACSIEDGAGFLRVNQEGNEIKCRIVEGDVEAVFINKGKGIKAILASDKIDSLLFDKDKWTEDKAKEWSKKHKRVENINTLVMNELSYDEKERMIRSSLRAKKEDAWVEAVYDEYVIYEENGSLYRQDYALNDGVVSWVGLPRIVEKQVTYVEILSGNDRNMKGNSMDKQKIVNALIENEHTSWTEEHRETLMAMDDTVLTNISKDIEDLSKELEHKLESTNVPTDNKGKNQKQEPTANAQPPEKKKPVSLQEYVENAPAEIREVLESGVISLNAERVRLIEVIKTNERNPFTDEQLSQMKIDMLQSLATLAKEPETTSNTIPLFSGQRNVVPNQSALPEPLLLPVMNFGEQKTG